MNRASHLNQAGIRTYDHTAYYQHPAYIAAADAIAELQRAFVEQFPDLPVNDFHHLLVDLAAGRRIVDKCPQCSDGPHLPYRVEHDDRGTTGHYRSGCGHEWFCGWGLTPLYVLDEAA